MKQLCVCLLLVFGAAEAQQAARPKVPVRKYEVSLGGGIALPFAPEVFNGYWTHAYHVSGGIGYSLSPQLTLALLGEYNSFVFNDATKTTAFAPTALVNAFLNLKYSFLPLATVRKWYPYIVAGAGVMNVSVSGLAAQPKGTTSVDELTFGIDGGAGIEYRLNTTTFIFLEGRGAMAFVTGNSYIALPARAGVRIRF
jgi:opacity protein-like surface antigen